MGAELTGRCWQTLLGSRRKNHIAFTCGPTALVETVANHLLELGYEPECIKTERFGPTGG